MISNQEAIFVLCLCVCLLLMEDLYADKSDFPYPLPNNIFTKLVTIPSFEGTVMVVIVYSAVIMGFEHYNQPDWITNLLYQSNVFVTFIFTGEMVCFEITLP